MSVKRSLVTDRYFWAKVVWTLVLILMVVLLIILPFLPQNFRLVRFLMAATTLQRHKTLVISLVLLTTVWLWLGSKIKLATEALTTLIRRGRPYKGEAAKPSNEELNAELVIGFQFTLGLFLFGSFFLEGSPIGAGLEQAGYAMSRSMLSTGKEDPQVVVIDTSNVRRIAAHPDQKPVTDRTPLRRFLDELAKCPNKSGHPTVVGIDINFHDPNGRSLHPADDDFFDACLNLEKTANGQLKIYLGVFEDIHFDVDGKIYVRVDDNVYLAADKLAPPEKWLGAEKNASLAADLTVSREDQGHLFSELVIQGKKYHPLLGKELARRYRGSDWTQPPWPFTIFSEREDWERGNPLVQSEGFLVNYNWLDVFEKQDKKSLDDFQSPAEYRELVGKMILLGDVKDALIQDAFVVPGTNRAVPGVYLHGCAAATLAKSPIRELRPDSRPLADLFLSLLVLASFIWQSHSAVQGREGPHEAVPSAFALGAIFVVVISVFLAFFHFFWPNALVVALLLALHPIVQWIIVSTWHKLSFVVSWIIRAIVPREGRSLS